MMKSFVSDTGVEIPAVSAAQMREVDRIAIEETGPNLFQMMENAGRNLAEFSIERLGAGWRRSVVIVLAGPGGNGGGGLCAARHLANRGLRVRVCLAEPDRMGEVPAFQRRVLESTSAEEVTWDGLGQADLILDALLGYSLRGPPRGETARLLAWANEARTPIIALDLPSGVDATTGATPGDHVRATSTMTLALPKTGLFVGHAGDVVLADIGIPEGVYRRARVPYRAPFDWRYRVPIRASSTSSA